MSENASNSIPLAKDVQTLMKKLSGDLYRAWRQEVGERLRNLEFQGEITKHDLNVPDSVWRLPNTEVRKALSKLQTNLQDAGYSYEFRFQDVDDANWILSYVIDLPEREESDDEGLEAYADGNGGQTRSWLDENECSHKTGHTATALSDVSDG